MASKKFIQALDLLESEKGIKKEIVLDALKEALEKSYKKNYGGPESIIRVEINEITGKIRLYEIKHVVDDVNDEDYELSLEEAQMINPKYQVGDDVVTEVDPEVFGRLAAIQTKQLLKQKIREAEKETLYNEYIDKKDDIINGTVDRVEERFAIINIGRTDKMSEQVFVRIDSFFTVLKFQPRNTEIIYLILLRGRQIAFNINKRAFFCKFFQNIFIQNTFFYYFLPIILKPETSLTIVIV